MSTLNSSPRSIRARSLRHAIVVACGVLAITSCSSSDDESGKAMAGAAADSRQSDSADIAGDASSTDDVEHATAFWEALAAGDRDVALSFVDHAFVDDGAGTPYGRAWTLERQFDWYDAVGWQWTLEECVPGHAGAVECTASASNAWSEALGVEPLAGTFVMSIGDDGVLTVNEQSRSFTSKWGPMVFAEFADWVETNRPDDARVMFDFGVDVNPEILTMYEDNTARFVEAQQNQ